MRFVTVVVIAASLVLSACGGEDSGGTYACSYEERTTDGCDGYGFGPYVAECYQFNSDDYYITPEQVCANMTNAGLHCQAGCCVDFEYRNVTLRPGGC